MYYADTCVVTGDRVISRAYAKINLTLDVTGVRKDGYHDLETIMQTVSLFDLVIVDKENSDIKLSTNMRFLPNNNKNIAYKAAEMFFKETGIKGGAKILLHKNIPVGAGMAGGSTNAAAVLSSLNRLYDMPLTPKRLMALGARIGADVPFCIMGGTAMAKGIGDKLTPLESAAGMNVLIVKPKCSISTQAAYKAIDEAEIIKHPDNDAMISAIKAGDLKGICQNVGNVFEQVIEKKHPIISGIKTTMNNNGALVSAMTGSGSAVFGIFPTAAKADNCAKLFYPDFKEVYSTVTL